MVDYPTNYKKPNLVEMMVDYIITVGRIDDWDKVDLGEWLTIEIDEGVKTFRLTDEEYKALSANLDLWIKQTYGEEIQSVIDKHIEEAKEEVKERLALMSDLYN